MTKADPYLAKETEQEPAPDEFEEAKALGFTSVEAMKDHQDWLRTKGKG